MLEYADELLEKAQVLYAMSKENPKTYHETIKDAAEFYRSWGGYNDEMVTSAAWIYHACNERENELEICANKIQYLKEAAEYHKNHFLYQTPSEESWDTKVLSGMYLLLSGVQKESGNTDFWPIDNFDNYLKLQTENILESSFLQMQKTPQGFPFYLQWGSARYASNLAFMGLLHNHMFKSYGFQNDIEQEVFELANFTVNYLLGENNNKQSFVVGYKKDDSYKTVERPHHKASSCPKWGEECGWDDLSFDGPNTYILYGALVGGPGQGDEYNDDRNDYIKNEVTCDYNAGFTGAVVGLKTLINEGGLQNIGLRSGRAGILKKVSGKDKNDFKEKLSENGGFVKTADPMWMFRRYRKTAQALIKK